jgi:hypothetical protein
LGFEHHHSKEFNMKQWFLSAVVTCLGLSAALSATAGPDFDAIARDRKARDAGATASASASAASQVHSATRTSSGCQPNELLPQLDHGPQAQTTPYLNRQRVERRDAALQACKDRTPATPAE